MTCKVTFVPGSPVQRGCFSHHDPWTVDCCDSVLQEQPLWPHQDERVSVLVLTASSAAAGCSCLGGLSRVPRLRGQATEVYCLRVWRPGVQNQGVGVGWFPPEVQEQDLRVSRRPPGIQRLLAPPVALPA